MTHFDRCAPGHVLLSPGQMQAKEYIVCLCVYTVYFSQINRVHMHVCASSFVFMLRKDRRVDM